MTSGLKDIISKLEQQRSAIDRALTALREADGSESTAPAAAPTAKRRGRPAKKKGGMTPEGRARLSEALRQRWAAKRAGSSAAPAKAKRTGGGMTPEGRARLSEALRQRWAAKRAAAKKAAKK